MVFGNMQVYGRVGDSVVELMSSLSEVLARRGVTFTLWADKTKMTNGGDFEVLFNPCLAKKLGCNGLTLYSSGHYIVRNPPDMSPETVPALFVYCDAIEHVVVGDVMAPLLRSIMTDTGNPVSFARGKPVVVLEFTGV